jgi:hypothetical protein
MTRSNLDTSGPNGHEQRTTSRLSTAEDVNPPQPGEPGYADYAIVTMPKWCEPARCAEHARCSARYPFIHSR